ncbi:hypothetical protein ATCC90586_005052 [Pythium insidiosum]|nr:hypothetical protein ATCC90586_005052 [Pythium insidiosum]
MVRVLFAALALLSAGGVLAQTAAPSSSAEWPSCPLISFRETAMQLSESTSPISRLVNSAMEMATPQCTTFKAPLCYDGVCKDDKQQEIEVFVKRILAPSLPDSRVNIIMMQGGPGAGSENMEPMIASVYAQLNGRVNVYTMDHRGTGRSTKLECVAAQAMTSGSPSGQSVDVSEVESCAAELEKRYGTDLAAFGVTSAANDLKLFISKYLKGKTIVYGVSYGTALVERLMHLNPPGVIGYVLDGVSAAPGDASKALYFSQWDTNYDAVAKEFMALCSSDLACSKYFSSSSLPSTVATLVEKTMADSNNKCRNLFSGLVAEGMGADTAQAGPAIVLRLLFGKMLANDVTRRLIAPLAYRLNRCSSDDQQVIAHFFFTFFSLMEGDASAPDIFTSDLVYKLIMYSEFWESPSPSFETMVDRFQKTSISSAAFQLFPTYCAFSKDNSPACKGTEFEGKYSASPIVYKKDQYYNTMADLPSNVSVLIMSGTLDPQTPHKQAEYLFDAIKSTKKKLVTFKHATHATIFSTPVRDILGRSPPCGVQVVSSFVTARGDLSMTDTSCVSSVPSASFDLPEAFSRLLFNSSNAFSGSYIGKDRDIESIIAAGKEAASGSPNAASSSSSNSSFKTEFYVFLCLFIVMLLAAAAFIYQWRRAKQSQAAEEEKVVEIETPVASNV